MAVLWLCYDTALLAYKPAVNLRITWGLPEKNGQGEKRTVGYPAQRRRTAWEHSALARQRGEYAGRQ